MYAMATFFHSLGGPSWSEATIDRSRWLDMNISECSWVLTDVEVSFFAQQGASVLGPAAYEELTRVPFIWSDPQADGPGRTAEIGQTHDIGTTVLERARVEPAIGMQGRSLLSGGREAAFIQYDHQKTNRGLGRVPRIHTLRTADWRLSMFEGIAWGELYHLRDDPGEFHNLWDSPLHARQRAELMEMLVRKEMAHVDRVPLPTAQA